MTRTRLTPRGQAVFGLVGAMLLVLLLGAIALPRSEAPVEKAAGAWTITRIELLVVDRLEGEATYYGPGLEGGTTANGEPFDPGLLTAAHPTVELGSTVRVVRPDGRSVVVRINDRLPDASPGRIDLTTASFQRIASLDEGRVPVVLELVEPRVAQGTGPM